MYRCFFVLLCDRYAPATLIETTKATSTATTTLGAATTTTIETATTAINLSTTQETFKGAQRSVLSRITGSEWIELRVTNYLKLVNEIGITKFIIAAAHTHTQIIQTHTPTHIDTVHV